MNSRPHKLKPGGTIGETPGAVETSCLAWLQCIALKDSVYWQMAFVALGPCKLARKDAKREHSLGTLLRVSMRPGTERSACVS